MANWVFGPLLDANQLRKASTVIVQGTMNEDEMNTFIQELSNAPMKIRRLEMIDALQDISTPTLGLLCQVIKLQSIVKISVTDTKLTLNAIEQLCLGLRHSLVESLDVTNIGLGPEGGRYLGKCLKTTRQLMNLKAGGNFLQGSGVRQLITRPLMRLAIPDNHVHERDWPSLLNTSCVYSRLDLSCAILTTQAINKLNLHTLVDLKLNFVDMRIIFEFFCQLLATSHLRWLEIRACQLNNEHMPFLRKALFLNKSLTRLDMTRNHLQLEGMTELVKGLNDNYTLTLLMVDPIPFPKALIIKTRLNYEVEENFTGMIIRLCLANEKLNLRGPWSTSKHQYHSQCTQDRIILLLLLWPLPVELAVNVFSNWVGIEGKEGKYYS